MKTILDKIVDVKKEEVARDKRLISLADIKKRALDAEPARDFLMPLKKASINVIAEIKKASPSLGVIRQDFKPIDIAQEYQDNGASCLSVLTDEQFFQGKLEYINQIKNKVKIPCLRKDFTINEYALFQARAFGADAILLIVAILDDHQLKDYSALAAELGMSCLIEVHDQDELNRANLVNPALLGVNNRNLKTFDVSVETSLQLLPSMSAQAIKISESGLKTGADLARLHQAGFNGFLIGESFMKQPKAGEALGLMIKQTQDSL